MQNNELEKRIITVATQIFIEKGYTETSMSDIAARLEINRPTLHYYYRTKEKLFMAIFGETVRQSVNTIDLILSTEESIECRLGKIIDSYFQHFEEYPEFPLFILKEIQRNSEGLLQEILEVNVQKLFKDVTTLYDSYIRQGLISDVPFVVALMTFYSLLICPFVSRRLITNEKINDRISFDQILALWKKNILGQMNALLNFRK